MFKVEQTVKYKWKPAQGKHVPDTALTALQEYADEEIRVQMAKSEVAGTFSVELYEIGDFVCTWKAYVVTKLYVGTDEDKNTKVKPAINTIALKR